MKEDPCSIFDDPSESFEENVVMAAGNSDKSSCEDTHRDIDNTSMIQATG